MPGMRARIATEAQEQRAIFQWAHAMRHKWPCLDLLFAIPNGGSRRPAEARNLKLSGVKPGVPDMFLPVSSGRYHGLWIELKRTKGGTIRPDQMKWIVALGLRGFATYICHGADEAIKIIENYLEGK